MRAESPSRYGGRVLYAVSVATIIITVAHAQTTSDNDPCLLPNGTTVSCGAHGSCMRKQYLGELAFEYDVDKPRALRQLVKTFADANHCKCHDGYWGHACEHACPQALGRPCLDRHVQPLPPGSPDERCGQVYHTMAGAGPANFSWALPGRCQCSYPYLGEACEWHLDLAQMAKPLPASWTPSFADLLKYESLVRNEADGSATSLRSGLCGQGVTPTDQGCACPAGVFPTHLRADSNLYLSQGGLQTATFPVKGRYAWSPLALPSSPTPWLFSQVPMCSISAMEVALPVGVAPPAPPPIGGQDSSSPPVDRPTSLPADGQDPPPPIPPSEQTLPAVGDMPISTDDLANVATKRRIQLELFTAREPLNASFIALVVLFSIIAVLLFAIFLCCASDTQTRGAYVAVGKGR